MRSGRTFFEAATIFARTEGIIPAPESSHEIRYMIDEPLRCKATNKEEVIVLNNSGHDLLDLSAYKKYSAGKLEDWEPTNIDHPNIVQEPLKRVPLASNIPLSCQVNRLVKDDMTQSASS